MIDHLFFRAIHLYTYTLVYTTAGQPYNYDDQELSEQWMRTLAGDDALQSSVTQKKEMVEAQVKKNTILYVAMSTCLFKIMSTAPTTQSTKGHTRPIP